MNGVTPMTSKAILVLLFLFLWHGEIPSQARGGALRSENPLQTAVEAPGAGACAVPGQTWNYAAAPEDAGWSSEKLAVARQYADSIHSSAVMIVQGGKIVD